MTAALIHVTNCAFQRNPVEDGRFIVYSFNRRHASFKDPEELGLGPPDDEGNPTILNKDLRAKFDAGLAYVLSYEEHGRCRWFLAGGSVDQWDGARVAGVLVLHLDDDALDAVVEDDAANYLEGVARAEIEIYTAWCNGDVYDAEVYINGKREDRCDCLYGQDHVTAWAEDMVLASEATSYEITWPWEDWTEPCLLEAHPSRKGEVIRRGEVSLTVLAHYSTPENLMVEQTDPWRWPKGGRSYLISAAHLDAWERGEGEDDPDDAGRSYREQRKSAW